MNNSLILWQNPENQVMPADVDTVNAIVGYANNSNLTPKQQDQIVKTFENGAYEMAAEYSWKKAITKLRKSLENLGADFICELLDRSDIDRFVSMEDVLTDRKAIELAEQLGIIGKTGALKLRQSLELVNHYISGEAEDELSKSDALSIVKTCVQYILCEQDVDVAVAFTNFRKRLLTETVSLQDGDVKQVLTAPLFYLRTVCTILLTAIKKEKGAQQEVALTNLNILIKDMWPNLADADRYSIGSAYSTMLAYGDNVATKGLKQALSKVNGFDYVPETIRSNTFKEQANKVIDTHYAFNNFSSEASPVRALANLGSIIPAPAFQDCIDAYLCVYLGNYYGPSFEAAPIARQQLEKVSADRWHYFFKNLIHQDHYVLDHIKTENQVARFASLLESVGYTKEKDLPKNNQQLYEAILYKDTPRARMIANWMRERLLYAE